MDELLKASARKRREKAGAPFELHPLARKMLQSEVARLTPKNSPARHWNLQSLWKLWPRLALVGACAAVLVLAAVISIQMPPDNGSRQTAVSKPELKVEKVVTLNEQAASEQKRRNIEIRKGAGVNRVSGTEGTLPADLKRELPAARAPVAVPESFRAADGDRSGDDKLPAATAGGGLAGAGNGVASPVPIPSGVVTETDRSAIQEELIRPATRTLSLAARSEARNPAQTGPPALPSSALQSAEANYYFSNNNPSRQRYLRVLASDKARARFTTPFQAILSSFEVEQTGAALRVIDADGSVYEGNFVAAGATPESKGGINSGIREQSKSGSGDQKTVKKESVSQNRALKENTVLLRKSADESTNWQNVAFRAVGTNRSLNKMVVFNGNFLLNSAAASNSNFGVQNQPSSKNDSFRGDPNSFDLLRAPISGNVVVGGSNPIQLDAKPVSP
jgi:hypothetical protein